GLPSLSQCVFTPAAPVTPGNSSVSVVMTIATTATTTARQSSGARLIFYTACLLLPGIVIGWRRPVHRPRRKNAILGWAGLFLFLLLVMTSCGGVSTGGGGGHQGTPPGTYKIIVTGTSSGTPPDANQSTSVTLIVN